MTSGTCSNPARPSHNQPRYGIHTRRYFFAVAACRWSSASAAPFRDFRSAPIVDCFTNA